jgi:hypothetical protein
MTCKLSQGSQLGESTAHLVFVLYLMDF